MHGILKLHEKIQAEQLDGLRDRKPDGART